MSNAPKRTPRALPRPVFVHPEVQTYLESGRWERLAGRATLVMKALAVQGTWHFKGVTGVNRGWRRTGLGGHGGYQFYLWWTAQGSGPGKALPLDPGAVVVRAVRHHDATDERTQLSVGQLEDYERVAQAHFDLGVESDPWTPAQREFLARTSRVRVLKGLPGSGKTTCLWETVERLAHGKVLYLTWSRALADEARRYFEVHASEDAKIEVRSFSEFLARLLEQDLEEVSFANAIERFKDLVDGKVKHFQTKNVIKRDPELYFGLLRGWIKGRHVWQGRRVPPPPNFGQAFVDEGTSDADDPIKAWDAVVYDALKRTRQAFDDLKLKPVEERQLYPELWAAVELKKRRRAVASIFSRRSWDLIVVDEVQDLTPAELDIILEVCKGKPSGEPPTELILAGDEGQSVRHTYFEWGELNNLLATNLDVPSEVQLDENQRNPAAIGRALQEAHKLYLKLGRGLRPGGQRVEKSEVAGEATVCLTEVASGDDGLKLLRELAEQTDAAFIHLGEKAPSWTKGDELVRDRLRTAAEAKGLEFGAVCVLGAADALSELTEDLATRDPLKYRLGVNRLRVAMSRATQTLAFIELAGPRTQEVVKLTNGEMLSPESLIDRLVDSDVPPDERLMRIIETARHDMEERPGPAWRNLLRVQALGAQEGFREAWGELGLEGEVHTLCARLALGQALRTEAGSRDPERAIRAEELATRGAEALEAVGGSELVALRDAVATWRRAKDERTKTETGARLVEALDALEGKERLPWLADELGRVRMGFLELVGTLARDVDTAGHFIGQVEFWLESFGFSREEAVERARMLRRDAFDNGMQSGRVDVGIALLRLFEPVVEAEDVARKISLLRATERHQEVAALLEGQGASQEAFEAWLDAGDIDEALRVAVWIEQAQRARLERLRDALWLLSEGGLEAREMRLVATRCLSEGAALERVREDVSEKARALEAGLVGLEARQKRLRDGEKALEAERANVLKRADVEAAERLAAVEAREHAIKAHEQALEVREEEQAELERFVADEQAMRQLELEEWQSRLENDERRLLREREQVGAEKKRLMELLTGLQAAELEYEPKREELSLRLMQAERKASEVAAASDALAEREKKLRHRSEALASEKSQLEVLKGEASTAKAEADAAVLRLEQRSAAFEGRDKKLKERERLVESREVELKRLQVVLAAQEKAFRAEKEAAAKGNSTP